jgi:hypothetical protein
MCNSRYTTTTDYRLQYMNMKKEEKRKIVFKNKKRFSVLVLLIWGRGMYTWKRGHLFNEELTSTVFQIRWKIP